MFYSSVVVDLMRPNNMVKVHAMRGDTGRGLDITIQSNGQLVTSSQAGTIHLCVLRPDGVVKSARGLFVANQNYCRVDLTEDMLGVSGECQCVLSITSSQKEITSPEFTMVVHKNFTNPEIPDEVVDIEDPLIGG